MNEAEAESILALHAEADTALRLLDDENGLREDWRIQFAAERSIERIFQAATALSEERRTEYFGSAGLKSLRGMRNRLAHNYLDIDLDILWSTISEDLPIVRDRMLADVSTAIDITEEALRHESADVDEWRRRHLGRH